MMVIVCVKREDNLTEAKHDGLVIWYSEYENSLGRCEMIYQVRW